MKNNRLRLLDDYTCSFVNKWIQDQSWSREQLKLDMHLSNCGGRQ